VVSFCRRPHLSQFPKILLRRFALSDKRSPHHEPRAVEGNESTQINDRDTCGSLP
jgi:hypothetical protein